MLSCKISPLRRPGSCDRLVKLASGSGARRVLAKLCRRTGVGTCGGARRGPQHPAACSTPLLSRRHPSPHIPHRDASGSQEARGSAAWTPTTFLGWKAVLQLSWSGPGCSWKGSEVLEPSIAVTGLPRVCGVAHKCSG